MKLVYVLRHANWDLDKGSLVNEGKEKCSSLKNWLGKFDLVIASDFERNKMTASLLADAEPNVDQKAGVLATTESQEKKIAQLRKTHPLGVAGAIFSTPELHEPVKEAGKGLLSLIAETLQKLPENGRALIVSHDGTMVAAEKIIKNESFSFLEKTYGELEGFIVDENLNLKKFAVKNKNS